jgi:hypothetical protein
MTLTRVGWIPLPSGKEAGFDHADLYPTAHRMYVAHMGADRVNVLDCHAHSFLRSLADLPGVAGVLIDEQQDLLFTSDRNIREPAEILVIDREQLEIERRFTVPAAGPHGLWLDHGRLFCAADEGALIVLDRDSGEVAASLPLPGAPDVVMHDPDLARPYVAIGEPGVVCSFDSDRLALVETVATEQDAHTIGWDPGARCLYVFCTASGGAIVFEERA